MQCLLVLLSGHTGYTKRALLGDSAFKVDPHTECRGQLPRWRPMQLRASRISVRSPCKASSTDSVSNLCLQKRKVCKPAPRKGTGRPKSAQ